VIKNQITAANDQDASDRSQKNPAGIANPTNLRFPARQCNGTGFVSRISVQALRRNLFLIIHDDRDQIGQAGQAYFLDIGRLHRPPAAIR